MSRRPLPPMLPWSTRPLPHRAPRRPGVCRVCGCTTQDACVVEVYPNLLRPDVEPVVETCSWIESDLCSRCHGPRRPTRAQVGELGRLRDHKGRVDVARGDRPGWLTVYLRGQQAVDVWGRPLGGCPVLDLAPNGVAVVTVAAGTTAGRDPVGSHRQLVRQMEGRDRR